MNNIEKLFPKSDLSDILKCFEADDMNEKREKEKEKRKRNDEDEKYKKKKIN
jgi:hypothetical protein